MKQQAISLESKTDFEDVQKYSKKVEQETHNRKYNKGN
jgi:hypothetical protein